jgi:hypothetical protein
MPTIKRVKREKRQSRDKRISKKSERKQKGGMKSDLVKVFVKRMLEVPPVIRLFHWKTDSYAAHKATDGLLETLNEIIDKYVETMLGKTNVKLSMSDYKTLSLETPQTNDDLEKYVKDLIEFLHDFHKKIDQEYDTDLLNIRDEIIGDLNRFLYLLRLH